MTCDAHHDGHDCRQPGACSRALVAMCERIDARSQAERMERERAGTVQVVWPDDPSYVIERFEVMA